GEWLARGWPWRLCRGRKSYADLQLSSVQEERNPALAVNGTRKADRSGARLPRHAARGRRRSCRLLFQHGPVEDVVILVVERAEEDAEDLPQILVVWRLLEAEASAVVEVHGELCREAFAQHLDGRRHLFLADLLILLFLGGCLEALPGEAAAVEVHEDIAHRLHVVPAALLDAQVGIDRRIARRARQVLVLPVWDVLLIAVVPVLLGQAEASSGPHLVAVAPNAHEEVVGFDVPVNEVFVVHILYVPNHLEENGSRIKHQHCLHGEASRAEVEQVLQAWTQQVHNQDIVLPLRAVPPAVPETTRKILPRVRYSFVALENFVELAFVQQLRMSRLGRFQLDGYFLETRGTSMLIKSNDISEGTAADFADQFEFSPDNELCPR
ncbi:unnamed protein product, partial [Ixodes hexagonus]